MKYWIYSLVFILVAASCGEAPASKPEKKEAGNVISVDSVEVLYYPDYKEQKQYEMTRLSDSVLLQEAAAVFTTDTITVTGDAYQYKLYLFDKGQPFKTLYVSVADSLQYVAYIVNGKRINHALTENFKAALPQF